MISNPALNLIKTLFQINKQINKYNFKEVLLNKNL